MEKGTKISNDSLVELKFDNSFNNNLSEDFDGIEAAVYVSSNNSLYLSAECSGRHCYILKADVIKENSKSYKIKITKKISVEKPARFGENDGFESIAYLPHENKLIVAYEKFKSRFAYKVDLDLNHSTQFTFPEMKYRLTDFYSKDNDELVCINSYVKSICAESHYEIQEVSLNEGTASLQNSINLENYNCEYNWEGIMQIKGGVLLINDNKFKNEPSYSSLFFFPMIK